MGSLIKRDAILFKCKFKEKTYISFIFFMTAFFLFIKYVGNNNFLGSYGMSLYFYLILFEETYSSGKDLKTFDMSLPVSKKAFLAYNYLKFYVLFAFSAMINQIIMGFYQNSVNFNFQKGIFIMYIIATLYISVANSIKYYVSKRIKGGIVGGTLGFLLSTASSLEKLSSKELLNISIFVSLILIISIFINYRSMKK